MSLKTKTAVVHGLVSHLEVLDGRFKGHGLKARDNDRGENKNVGKTEHEVA